MTGRDGMAAPQKDDGCPVRSKARDVEQAAKRGIEKVESGIKTSATNTARTAKETFREVFKTKKGELGYLEVRTWGFWRGLIMCFCLMNLIGHMLEIPYCLIMDSFFGIVDESYAVWTDPWYHPYWVYGFGAVAMTFLIEPIKERLVTRRKTLFGAFFESFVIVVIASAVLECAIGFAINPFDPATGTYPYWDNSHLPGNILGQAWIVNDLFIGLGAMLYVWLIFPLTCKALRLMGSVKANVAFALVTVGFVACCVASYWQLIASGAFA